MIRRLKLLIEACRRHISRLEPTERIVLITILILTVCVLILVGAKFFLTEKKNNPLLISQNNAHIKETQGKSADEELKKTVADNISVEFLKKHGNIKSVQLYDYSEDSKTAAGESRGSSVLYLILDPFIPYLADEIIYTEAEKRGLTASNTRLAGNAAAGISDFIYYELQKDNAPILTVKIEVLSERAHEEKMTDEMSGSGEFGKILNMTPGHGQSGMVIIIDDLGYSLSKVKKFEVLHPNLVFSVLPLLPQSKAITEHLGKNKRFFMMHMPMEPHNYPRLDPGPGVILTKDSTDTVREKMLNAIASIDHVSGVNNHMGSKLTENLKDMDVIFQVMAGNNMFFIDSRTTMNSVGRILAKKYRVPYAERDVFLDNNQDIREIQKQFNRALRIVKRKGYAIVIGHPFTETFQVLKKEIPLLAEKNIAIITPQALFGNKP